MAIVFGSGRVYVVGRAGPITEIPNSHFDGLAGDSRSGLLQIGRDVLMPLNSTDRRLGRAAALLLAGAAPLLLSAAMLAPNLALKHGVELTCARTPSGVMCEERTQGLLGRPAVQRYGPVQEFANTFLPVVQSSDEPQNNEKLSTLAVRTAQGEFHPFAGLAASPLPPSMLVVSPQVAQAVAQLTPLLNDPSAAPVTIRRSGRYPIGFLVFDILACIVAVATLWFWTPPLWQSAWLYWRGAPADEAAQPLVRLAERGFRFLMARKQAER
jgi:hypothetical protein